MSAVAAQSGSSAALRFARGINVGLAVFLVLYGTIAVLQPAISRSRVSSTSCAGPRR